MGKFLSAVLLDSGQPGQVVKNTIIAGKSDRHGRASKPTRALFLCPWKRHFFVSLEKKFFSSWRS